MKEGSMKLRIAYNQHGEILAATQGGSQADQIVAPPGVTVAELDVPTKFEKAKFEDFVHRLHVDVHKKQLAERT
jgi:hypothetical protein